LILKKTAGGKIGENPNHGGFLIAAAEQTGFDR